MNKNCLLAVASLLLISPSFAQNIGINADGSRPNPNAILDIKSGNKGLLIPRMDSLARNAIPNTKGLLVYDISTDNFWYNTGKGWECLRNDKDKGQGGNAWLLTGNANTKDGVNFLGNTDYVPLNIRVNNVPSGKIDPAKANAFWGYQAGELDSGSDNTAMGQLALKYNVGGYNNTAIGFSALYSNTTGFWNTANGYQTLRNNTTGTYNTATGDECLWSNINGFGNTATGILSMYLNVDGSNNTAYGETTLYNNSSGGYNTAIGIASTFNNTTGSYNTALGEASLDGNRTGSYITAVGTQADVSVDGLTNATAIGYGATVDVSNKVRIGNSAVTVIEGQVPFTTPSDGRYKFNVEENVKGLDFILHLRPVTYQFDVKRFDAHMQHQPGKEDGAGNYALQAGYDEATRIRRSGFIAQEVEQAANASGYDFSGIIKPKTDEDHYSLSYDAFVVPLVKAVQEQQQIILQQNKKLDEQEKRLSSLQTQLDELKKLLQPAN